MPAIPTSNALDVIVEHLYTPEQDLRSLPISKATVGRILRVREMYTRWMANPQLEEEEIRYFLEQSVGTTQALADMQVLKAIVGTLNQDVKAWHAYRFNKEIKRLYKKALSAKDLATAEKCLKDYAKYNRLDQNDTQLPDYSKITPGEMIFSTDPRDGGFEPIKNLTKEVERMRRKLMADAAEDASYEEIEEAAAYSGERKEE